MLDQVQTDEGNAEVDAVQDHLRDEGTDLHRLENGGAVVEEVIGAGQLLEHLQHDSEPYAVAHTWCSAHDHELRDRIALGLDFCPELVPDLFHLHVDTVVVSRRAIDLHQSLFCLFNSSVSIVKPWRLREEQDADSEHNGPDPAETDDDAPRRRTGSLVGIGSVVEACCQEDSQGDEQLVSTHQSSSNPRGSSFGLIHWHKQAQSTDSEAGNKTADHHLIPRRRSSDLDDETNCYDQRPERN